MFRLCGIMVLIPIAVLLTLSFFVLFAVEKVQSNNVKLLGKVAAVVLWVAALVALLMGIYVLSTGGPCGKYWKHHMNKQGKQSYMKHNKEYPGCYDMMFHEKKEYKRPDVEKSSE